MNVTLFKDGGNWGRLITCSACDGHGIGGDLSACYECSGQGQLFEEWHPRKIWCLDPNRPMPMDCPS